MRPYWLSFVQVTVVLVLALVSIAGCGPRTAPSKLQEGPLRRDEADVFGLSGPFTWADIQEPKEYSLPNTPWTDTYWPTYKKGVANRYQNDMPEGVATFNLAAYLETLFDAVDSRDVRKLAKLSPAEKHDLLLGADLSRFGSMSREDLMKKAKTIQSDLDSAIAVATASNDNSINKTKSIITAIRKSAEDVNDVMRDQDVFTQVPLLSSAWGEWSNNVRNSSNLVDGRDQLTIEGLDVVGSYANPDSYDWSWEGICHGWSPAALYSQEPHHAVMASKSDGTNILFYEGDIRALLSKSWADQAPRDKEVFVGGRCNSKTDDIKTDQYGRILDGTLTCSGSQCGDLNNAGVTLGEKFKILHTVAQRFTVWDKDGADRFMVSQSNSDATLHVRIFGSVGELQHWAKSHDNGVGVTATLKLQSDCRDVQPMTLHLLMTKVMAKGQGFVMDRTRSAQVWNQPVKGYKFIFEKIEGGAANPNELSPIANIRDNHWQFRAPHTAYLANVTATLDWIKENGPRLTYKNSSGDIDDQSVHSIELKYTLEFDADKKLIGSEWGHVPTSGDTSDSEDRNGQAPDFVFYYQQGAEPLNENRDPADYPSVDYDHIVKKLHKCSLDDSGLATFDNGSGSSYPYKVCPID